MAKPRSKPQLNLTSAHIYDDAAGIPEDHWSRVFYEHIYSKLDDADFADLYEHGGRYPISPALLVCITMLQYMFSESDRRAVENTVLRRDWRIALGRDRDYDGFAPSVLCNFRKRLLKHQASELVFDQVLKRIVELKLLDNNRLLRVDSTRLIANVADLSRCDAIREAMRIVVCNLPDVKPKIVKRAQFRELEDEYGREVWLGFHDEIKESDWRKLALDGQLLLRLCGPYPVKGRDVLERMLDENFVFDDDDGTPKPRAPKERPDDAIITPHEPDVRAGRKGNQVWRGDKAHFVETADPDSPNFIVHADVVDPRLEDSQVTKPIACQSIGKMPNAAVLLGDSGYASAENSKFCRKHKLDLIAPPRADTSNMPIPASEFHLDFAQCIAICPEGHQSISWRPDNRRAIKIRFKKATCMQCPRYAECIPTGAERGRLISISKHYDQLRIDRKRAQLPAWKKLYKLRSPIEATISELVHCCGLRRSRYRTAIKRRMHALFAAAALNVRRLLAYLTCQQAYGLGCVAT